MHLVTLALLVVAGLPPDEVALIERDQKKAQADVDARYGNRRPAELSPDERREKAREELAAQRQVLDQHGVSDKDWSLGQARLSREEREQVSQARKALEEKEEAAAKAKEQPAPASAPEVPVQRGFDEAKPVELETAPDATQEVVVEEGLPPEVLEDQALAAEQDRLEARAPAEAPPRRAAEEPLEGEPVPP